MAKQVFNHSGKILSVLVILFLVTVVRKIDGHPTESPDPTKTSPFDEEKNGPVPSCANTTFCLETPYYPTDLVDVLVRAKDIKYLAAIDEPVEPYRLDFGTDGEALCHSQEMVINPKTALNIDGLWLYVVNYEEYVQTVRVEICARPNQPCKFVDGLSEGWKSACRQTYVYRQMVAVTRDGRIAPQLFKFPSSCKCYVKYTGDPFMRLGPKNRKSKGISYDSSKEPIQ